jgi:hypothetical protein
MAVATLSPTLVSVRSAKPGYVYGASAKVPISTQNQGLIRVGMPADIPSNAQIVSAILTLTQVGSQTVGNKTVAVQRNQANWTVSKATWNNRPGLGGAAVSVVKSGTPDGTLWAFDVTPDVASFVAGASNYGWRISSPTNPATTPTWAGSSAAQGKPQLVITYLTPTDAPIGLTPTGNQAVSVAKPWLSFQAPPDTTAIDVQIDADMVAPYDFDSGDVLSTYGSLDLSTTAYGGLAAGGPSVYWRARTKSSLGYSPWSDWAQMCRVAKPVVTITSPGATSDDTTPPVVWTAPGQTSWQVVITDSQGKVVADSGQIIGADTTWTPPKAVSTEGQSATIEVRAWDGVDRVATAGDPVYSNAFQTFTAAGTDAVAPADSFQAVPDGLAPVVRLYATRANNPDSWTVVRDGVRIATGLPGVVPFSYEDWTADPNHEHTYRAAPATTGVGTASGGPEVTVTPRAQGIWVIDPADTTKRAIIWGQDAGDFDATELAVIHQPIAGPPVRRVSYRPPLSGSISGDLVDVGTMLADDQIAVLYDMKGNDRNVQLVLGDRNLLVRLGDLMINPTPDSGVERHSIVSFSWWEQGTPPWSP